MVSMLLSVALPPSVTAAGDALAAEEAAEPAMDQGAFESIYARTARPLRAYLTRMSGDAALADDLLQEAYCRLLKMPALRQEEDQVRAYLWRIAANLLNDHWRASRREAPAPEADPAVPHRGAESDLRSDVGRVLQEMRPRDRSILWLAYVEGSSHREIAGVLGLRERSVRVMLFRARRRLAGLLRARGLGSEGSP